MKRPAVRIEPSAIAAEDELDDSPMSVVIDAALQHLLESEENATTLVGSTIPK